MTNKEISRCPLVINPTETGGSYSETFSEFRGCETDCILKDELSCWQLLYELSVQLHTVTAHCWRMLMTSTIIMTTKELMTDLTTAMTNAMLRVPCSELRSPRLLEDCVLKHISCWATDANKHTRKENHRDRSPRTIVNRLGLKFLTIPNYH